MCRLFVLFISNKSVQQCETTKLFNRNLVWKIGWLQAIIRFGTADQLLNSSSSRIYFSMLSISKLLHKLVYVVYHFLSSSRSFKRYFNCQKHMVSQVSLFTTRAPSNQSQRTAASTVNRPSGIQNNLRSKNE